MLRSGWSIYAMLFTVSGVACQLFSPAPSPTPTFVTPRDTPFPSPLETTPAQAPTDTVSPSATGECQIVGADQNVIAYTRPSFKANEFGTVTLADFPIGVEAKTADGWLGFEPGVAQAANVGVFRLRWVNEQQVHVAGDCTVVVEVVGPPPGICFTMPMEDVTVYAKPNNSAAIIATLRIEQYAAVIGTNGAGWAKLDLSLGNSGVSSMGWVGADSLNFNGPCDNLPVVGA